jgi:hypothetical protein
VVPVATASETVVVGEPAGDRRAVVTSGGEATGGRRFHADTPLDHATRQTIESLKRTDPAARARFAAVRDEQLRQHPGLNDGEHTAAQRANATQMANKVVAIEFLDWPRSAT